VAATAAFGPQIGQPSRTFSATLRTVRIEAKTSVPRVLAFVPDAEEPAAAERASREGEGAAGGSLRLSNFQSRSRFRAGLDMAGSGQDLGIMYEIVQHGSTKEHDQLAQPPQHTPTGCEPGGGSFPVEDKGR
jgi:hypothetical protein